MNDKKYLTLIDGSGYIFRAYFAIKRIPGTNAIFGFCSMLLKVLEEKARLNDTGAIENEKIIIVFDKARKNWRNEIFPEYKANRSETPDDLKPQFGPIKECAKAFGMETIELDGYEADDIIATYAEQAKKEGYLTRVISSDKDLMQLVEDDKVYMFDSMKNIKIDEAKVLEKFGVSPSQVPDAQGLIGDTADNIPGVPNIGPKKAAALIQEFNNIENLVANAEKISNEKIRNLVKDNTEKAIISKKLATLSNSIELETHISKVPHATLNETGMREIIKTFSFNELANRFEHVIKLHKESYGDSGFKNKEIKITIPTELEKYTNFPAKPKQESLF